MSGAPIRVAVVTSPPTPYREPLFARIAADPALALHVLYAAAAEPTRPFDPGPPRARPYPHRFLRGRRFTVGRGDRHSWFLDWDVLRALREARPDVVVAWGWWQFASLAAVYWCRCRCRCRARGVPYVLFSETHRPASGSGPRRALREAVASRVVGGARAWLATGSLSARNLVRLGAAADGVFPFANAPDVEALAALARDARLRRSRIRERLGIPPAAPTVAFVGRFVAKKGVDVLLTAFARVRDTIPDAVLLLFGDGPQAPCLRRLAAPLGRAVVFAGFAPPETVHEAYVAADVVAVPSLAEPWGVVVLEALACGVPVVASDAVGAATDALSGGGDEEGRPGLVVEAGDAEALSRALVRILSTPDRGRSLGDRGPAVAARFGHGASAVSFRLAVERAAASRRGVAP